MKRKPANVPKEYYTITMWGDRTAIVEDLAGNRWWIATQRKEVSNKDLIATVSSRSKKKS